jgi:DNA processing protein
VVVSGLAEGIDTAAHNAAIEAGGRTIAVLGTPLDRTYPRSNTDLQKRIIREHVAVSQFASGFPTRPSNFILRNRTMALIVSASIIVEASDTSGALSQGWEALRLGRLLFIMESLFQKSDKWPYEMVNYGAQVLSDENTGAFLDVLPVGRVSDDTLAF